MPSQAIREDYEDVAAIMSLRSYARAYHVVMAEGVSREDANKRGVPDALIDQVMDNEAAVRGLSNG